MIHTSIDRIDHTTGREVDIPSEVLSVVEGANRILAEQLRSVDHLPLHATWCRFAKSVDRGWTVTLDVYTEEYGYGQQLRVDDLRDPAKAKELIRETLWEFGRTYSRQAGEQIRQVREDLKRLLTVPGD